jgi:hypothetical protein
MPAQKAMPHRKWMETPIGFNTTDCPKSMVGVEQLSHLVSSTIANIRLYHVLIDGGAVLNDFWECILYIWVYRAHTVHMN